MNALTILAAHLVLLTPASPALLAPAPYRAAAADAPVQVAAGPDDSKGSGKAKANGKAKAKANGKAKAKANGASVEAKREKVRQRIRALRAWRLTEALDLDEQTAAALFPVINRYDERFEATTAAGARIHRQLRKAVDAGDPARTDQLVDELVEHQRELWELQEARFRDVRKVLTPEQAARILILLPEIDRAIHGEIRKAMRSRSR